MSSPTETDRDAIDQLLQLSRLHIAEGNSKEALESVIRAIIANTGEASVLRILDEANRRAKIEKEREIRAVIVQCCRELREQASLLSETGDEHILIDAFQDGSSVLCQRCRGLISVDRAEAHARLWCPALGEADLDDDDDMQ